MSGRFGELASYLRPGDLIVSTPRPYCRPAAHLQPRGPARRGARATPLASGGVWAVKVSTAPAAGDRPWDARAAAGPRHTSILGPSRAAGTPTGPGDPHAGGTAPAIVRQGPADEPRQAPDAAARPPRPPSPPGRPVPGGLTATQQPVAQARLARDPLTCGASNHRRHPCWRPDALPGPRRRAPARRCAARHGQPGVEPARAHRAGVGLAAVPPPRRCAARLHQPAWQRAPAGSSSRSCRATPAAHPDWRWPPTHAAFALPSRASSSLRPPGSLHRRGTP